LSNTNYAGNFVFANSDYLNVGNSLNTFGNISMTAWIKPDAYPVSDHAIIVNQEDAFETAISSVGRVDSAISRIACGN